MSETNGATQQPENPDTSRDNAEGAEGAVPDEALPEDLQPTDDNPLAQEPDEDAEQDAGIDALGEAPGPS